MVRAFTIGFSRTINLGNFESARVEASVTVDVETDADLRLEVQDAQIELRRLLEETWKTQLKERPKNGRTNEK